MATAWAAAASVRALQASRAVPRHAASVRAIQVSRAVPRRFAAARGHSDGTAGSVLGGAPAVAAALVAWSQLGAARGEEVEPTAAPPVFQTRVWQAVAGGDIKKAVDWESQDLGLDQGGNLCCIGKGGGAARVYHTREDLAKASVEALPEGAACWPFCFCVQVPGSQPVVFAAASPAFRELWMHELASVVQAPSA